MSKNISKPEVKRVSAKEITWKARGYRFTWRAGFDVGNGIEIEDAYSGWNMYRSALKVVPAEGIAEDWLDQLVDLVGCLDRLL